VSAPKAVSDISRHSPWRSSRTSICIYRFSLQARAERRGINYMDAEADANSIIPNRNRYFSFKEGGVIA
jgi:hypothetical protein